MSNTKKCSPGTVFLKGSVSLDLRDTHLHCILSQVSLFPTMLSAEAEC